MALTGVPVVPETHRCPAPNCDQVVPHERYACRPHWYSLPKDIRNRIWAAFRSGDRRKHLEAMADGQSYLVARFGGEPAHAD